MADYFTPLSPSAILYRTHFWDLACESQFAALRNSLSADYDIAVVGVVEDPRDAGIPADLPQMMHKTGDLEELGYPGLALIDPSHVNVLLFFRQFPQYEYYWMLEYDVRYTGDWAGLLRELSASRADLLSTVVQSRAEHPSWIHWQRFDTRGAVKEAGHVKAFTPLMRLSNAAMRAIDAAYKEGWTGHYEAVWPTAIAAAGLSVEEIGGEGRFTPPDRYGRYYTNARHDPHLSPGSFVFRPSFLEHEIPLHPPGLWHPVKSAAMHEPMPPPPPRPPVSRLLQPAFWWRRLRQFIWT